MTDIINQLENKYNDGLQTPELKDLGSQAPVFGTESTFLSSPESGSFVQDFTDYYTEMGGNQTATGIVDSLVSSHLYKKDENYNPFEDSTFASQSTEFKEKYLDFFAQSKNQKHSTDLLIKFNRQEEVLRRLNDPNYDAHNIAAILGGVSGALFDTTTFIPVASFGTTARMSKIYNKLARQVKKGKDISANSEIMSAKILSAVSGGAQFSAAEYLREELGGEEFVRPPEEIMAQVAAAGLFGGALHTLLATSSAKYAAGVTNKDLVQTISTAGSEANKIKTVVGNEIQYPDSLYGKGLKKMDQALATLKPGLWMASSESTVARDISNRFSGTVLEQTDINEAPGIIFETQIKSQKAFLDVTDIEDALTTYTKRTGTKVDHTDFKNQMLKAIQDNDGRTLDEWAPSGIKEIDDHLKQKVFPVNKQLVEEAQAQGLLQGVDPNKFHMVRRIDSAIAREDPIKAKAAIAKSMASADRKAAARFTELETQLKQLGLKISRNGRLTKKALQEFIEKNAADKNGTVKSILDEYLDTIDKSIRDSSEELDFRKAAPKVKEDYSEEADAFYADVIGENISQTFGAAKSYNRVRAGRVDWNELRELESPDWDDNMLRNFRSLVKDTQMIRYFGDPNGKMSPIAYQLDRIAKEQKERLTEVGRKFKEGKISNEKRLKLEDKIKADAKGAAERFEGLVNRFYDKTAYGDVKHGWVEAIRQGLIALTNIPLLGLGVISQLVDITNIIDYKWASSLANIQPNAKRIITSDTLGIDTKTLERYGIKAINGFDQRARMMHGESYDSSLFMSREKNMLGISPKGIANWARWLNEKSFNLNVMTPMNNQTRASLFRTDLESISNLAVHKGKLSKESQAYLKNLGISDELLGRIKVQLSENKRFAQWDPQLADDIAARITKKIENEGVIAPNIGDKPFVMDQTALAGFAMLKGFMLGAVDRYLLRDIRSGYRGFNRMAARTLLGTTAYMIRETIKQGEVPQNKDPAVLLMEGIYRSGNFPVFDFMAETADQAFGIGPEGLLGVERYSRRFYNANTGLMQVFVGAPSLIFKDIERIGKKAFKGTLTKQDALAMAKYYYRFSPFYVQFPVKHLLED